jgi:hypothetical protein
MIMRMMMRMLKQGIRGMLMRMWMQGASGMMMMRQVKMGVRTIQMMTPWVETRLIV